MATATRSRGFVRAPPPSAAAVLAARSTVSAAPATASTEPSSGRSGSCGQVDRAPEAPSRPPWWQARVSGVSAAAAGRCPPSFPAQPPRRSLRAGIRPGPSVTPPQAGSGPTRRASGRCTRNLNLKAKPGSRAGFRLSDSLRVRRWCTRNLKAGRLKVGRCRHAMCRRRGPRSSRSLPRSRLIAPKRGWQTQPAGRTARSMRSRARRRRCCAPPGLGQRRRMGAGPGAPHASIPT